MGRHLRFRHPLAADRFWERQGFRDIKVGQTVIPRMALPWLCCNYCTLNFRLSRYSRDKQARPVQRLRRRHRNPRSGVSNTTLDALVSADNG